MANPLSWVEGETHPKSYILYTAAVRQSLSGMTVTAVLRRKDGTLVPNPGTVTPDGDQGANPGLLSFAPNAGIFRAADGPYYARFRADNGATIRYFPSSGRGDEWPIESA